MPVQYLHCNLSATTIFSEAILQKIIVHNYFYTDLLWLISLSLFLYDWLIFLWHVKLSRVILCLEVLELHSFSIHIYIFLCNCFLRVFLHTEYKWFLNRSIWPIDSIETSTTTPGQSGPGSNGNKKVLLICNWMTKFDGLVQLIYWLILTAYQPISVCFLLRS